LSSIKRVIVNNFFFVTTRVFFLREDVKKKNKIQNASHKTFFVAKFVLDFMCQFYILFSSFVFLFFVAKSISVV